MGPLKLTVPEYYREFKNATSWRFCSSVRFIEKR
jgi:hypothetical protein